MEPKVKIDIDGTAINGYNHLSVVQKMYDHHTFKIVIGHEVQDELGSHTLDKSKDWLGKIAIISMGEYDFVGIVTTVNMVHKHGHFGDLVIEGYSKTIMLEAGPHLFSWADKSLRDIVDETVAIASGLSTTIKPKYSETIGYISQHRESHYGFLKRIACQFNEWMFYDGEKLLFGEPSSMPTIPLIYGQDSENIQISARMRPHKYDSFSYNSGQDMQIEGSTTDSVSGLDELGAIAFKAAKDTFNFNPRISSGPRVPDKSCLDDVLKNLQSAAAANMSVASGSTTKRELRPGVVIDFKSETYDGKSWKTKPYGQYLVTTVHHTSSHNFHYLNHFEAIPAGVKVLPEPNVPTPVAYSQAATVLSNDDPKQQGRVQVQMQWQEIDGLNTNWIRVMTPDAGKSDLHPKNRGFVYIPEVGDKVMLGFRYGDPSRPFVAGSMFHGMTGAGGDKDNVIRSMITKSGHELIFDDTKGQEMITITDKNKNSIVIDTKGDSIYVSANETIEMKAKNINLIASENIKMLADKNIEGGAGKDASLTACDSVLIDGGKDVNLQAGKTLKGAGGKDIKFSSGSGSNLDLEANGKAKLETSKSIDLKTKDATIATKKQTNITANKVFMEGSMKTIIKGNKVDIS